VNDLIDLKVSAYNIGDLVYYSPMYYADPEGVVLGIILKKQQKKDKLRYQIFTDNRLYWVDSVHVSGVYHDV